MLSREVPIDPAHAALLFVDVQNYNARPDGGEYAAMTEAERDARYGYFFRTMRETALPNMQRLQAACRHAGIEVMYTVIEALTRDGRDLSLDYKISGLFVPRGSWDAKVLDVIAPVEDEMVLPKTSSSVFISTNIDYVLRNLGVRSLMIAGALTDQCIDFGGAGCVRSGVSGDGTHRCLRHTERGTTRVGAAQQPWILQADHDGGVGAGDRRPCRLICHCEFTPAGSGRPALDETEVVSPRVRRYCRHSRASGNPGRRCARSARLGSRLRGNDETAAQRLGLVLGAKRRGNLHHNVRAQLDEIASLIKSGIAPI